MRYTRPLLTAIGVGCLALSQLVVANIRRESRIESPECTAGTCTSEQGGQVPGPVVPDPTATVIDTPCIELVDVELGQAAKIVRADGQSFAGAWSADFGQMTSDGTYIAPRNVSAPGVDRIVLHAPAGPGAGAPVFTVWVQLVPSSRQPLPESTELVFDPPEIDPSQNPGAPEAPLPLVEHSTELESPDDTPEAGLPQNLLAVQIGDDTGYVVPAYFAAALASPATAVAVVFSYPGQAVKRSKCGVLPPLKGACTTTTEQRGPTKEVVGAWRRESLWVMIDDRLHRQTGLPLGNTQISYDFRRRIKYHYKDWYYCVGGQLRYAGTEICHAYGLEYRYFTPPLAFKIFFPYGSPLINYGEEECTLYSIP